MPRQSALSTENIGNKMKSRKSNTYYGTKEGLNVVSKQVNGELLSCTRTIGHNAPQPEPVSFRWFLEMSTVLVLSKTRRHGVSHTRNGSTECSVAETVPCAWNSTRPHRRRSKQDKERTSDSEMELCAFSSAVFSVLLASITFSFAASSDCTHNNRSNN